MRTPVCPIADVPLAIQAEACTVGDGEPRPAGGGRLDNGLRIAGSAQHRRRPVALGANASLFDQMLVVAALLSVLSTRPCLPGEGCPTTAMS